MRALVLRLANLLHNGLVVMTRLSFDVVMDQLGLIVLALGFLSLVQVRCLTLSTSRVRHCAPAYGLHLVKLRRLRSIIDRPL